MVIGTLFPQQANGVRDLYELSNAPVLVCTLVYGEWTLWVLTDVEDNLRSNGGYTPAFPCLPLVLRPGRRYKIQALVPLRDQSAGSLLDVRDASGLLFAL